MLILNAQKNHSFCRALTYVLSGKKMVFKQLKTFYFTTICCMRNWSLKGITFCL